MHLSILLFSTLAVAVPFAHDLLPRSAEPSIIPGSYIITLRNHTSSVASFLASHSFLSSRIPDRTYEIDSFRGFSMLLSATEASTLTQHPVIRSVEPDMLIPAHALTTQSSPSWGLPKLSQGPSSPSRTYTYDTSAGAGTCVYVIDTGVAVSHPDFGGRAIFGANFEPTDGSDEDLAGHGTHVAGTIASSTYGVARATKLIAVKACNRRVTCRYQDIVSGLTWATQDSKTRGCDKGTVVNLSLGGWGTWVATKEAVNAAAANGIFVAVAAGNSAKDASDVYPASAPNACTVAASDSDDSFATFSNFGSVIDVIAPGVQIQSLSPSGGTAIMSGTSMASPHIAGLAAYLLGFEGSADPVALCQKIKDRAIKDKVKNVPNGTNNLLAYNGAQGEARRGAAAPTTPASSLPSVDGQSAGQTGGQTGGQVDDSSRHSGLPSFGGLPTGGSSGSFTSAPIAGFPAPGNTGQGTSNDAFWYELDWQRFSRLVIF
ncbi:Subtilisin-like protease [Sphaceloma murrayae]|uniref:Subtilisin-like protease n=1 Tax=Sphaceloma murrayae TaxID=2082308 RepID=A0A2K1QMY8_9PEZI|nr:Subtilisin-like protease [Sphaceloma murrayae]